MGAPSAVAPNGTGPASVARTPGSYLALAGNWPRRPGDVSAHTVG
ncbi:hypothetical protein [Micromonospora sp. NPDC023888]